MNRREFKSADACVPPLRVDLIGVLYGLGVRSAKLCPGDSKMQLDILGH